MTRKLTALVSGAGFAGLTVSTALAQRGWNVTLFERQPELRTAGAGIYLWENGLRILAALGLGDIATHAYRGYAMEQRGFDNSILDSGEMPPEVRLVTLHRRELLEALKRAALEAGVNIRTNAEVIGATAQGELSFASRQTLQADLVIGADGVWSPIRKSLGLELTHEQTSEGAIRAIIRGTPEDLGAGAAGKYIECWSGMRRFLITPLATGEIYLALTCQNVDEEGRNLKFDKASWKASFPQWGHLIDRIDDVLSWSPFSIIKVRSWSAGRAAIVGDAAHAQPPNLGQGGGMAMQSALALAAHLQGIGDPRDIPERLLEWETQERPLAEHCQRWSCLYGEISTLPDDMRARAIPAAMGDPWVRGELLRAARSNPFGAA